MNDDVDSAVELASEFIAIPSVSSESNAAITDCLQLHLAALGMQIERCDYVDQHGVPKCNVIAKLGSGTGGLAYFGHTDVVPAEDWQGPGGPFSPTIANDRLYGRGSCDMKGSLAAFIAAAASLRSTKLRAPLYLVATADEEIGYFGAFCVIDQSELFAEMLQGGTRGVIGEPTGLAVVYAHKGTFGLQATSRGEAAHTSTAAGRNANLAMIPFLAEMKAIHDETESQSRWLDPRFNPPSVSWNIGVNDFATALNVKPARSVCTVYFRPMPGQDIQELVTRSRDAAERLGLEFEVLREGAPLYVDPESPFVRETAELAGGGPPQTVPYGTDGCVFRKLREILVCGPGDIAQAHTKDEWLDLGQLAKGIEFYRALIEYNCVAQRSARGKLSVATASTPPTGEPLRPVRIRAATVDDLDGLEELIAPFVQARLLLPRTKTELAKLLEHGFVAEQDQHVRGFAAVEFYSKKLGEVQCLCVHADLHGQGIGRQLVRQCIERGRAQGVLELLIISAPGWIFAAVRV